MKNDSSNEMFYLDKDGVKRDAELHADMLDNPAAEKAADELAAKQAAKRDSRFVWKECDVTIRPATKEEKKAVEQSLKQVAARQQKKK